MQQAAAVGAGWRGDGGGGGKPVSPAWLGAADLKLQRGDLGGGGGGGGGAIGEKRGGG